MLSKDTCVTLVPYYEAALRMRRFYVRPNYRRQGIARMLANSLIQNALKVASEITVNAGTEIAPVFWENMGFKRSCDKFHTHTLSKGHHS